MPAARLEIPTIPTAVVASHNTEESCYVTAGVNVYDITDFLPDHPGGGDLILEYGGKDVSDILRDTLSHQHSDVAYEILDERFIGHVATKAIQDSIVEHNHPPDIFPPMPNGAGKEVLKANPAAQADMDGKGIFAETKLKSPEEQDTDLVADYQKHKFIDLNKPMLMQVWRGGFSKEFYLKEVHQPRYYKGSKSAPLFGNFLEPLSLTPYWVVPLIWVPCVMLATWKADTGLPSHFQTAAYWITGFCLWSLVEYGMHRGLFHVDNYLPDNRVGITGHFLLHGIHHYLPMDRYRLVMPPTLFVVLAAPFYKLAQTVFYYDWFAALAVFAGGVFGYICYDETHYFLHHKQLPSYYRNLKKYHLAHHYDDYENGFGVTSRFWDIVFGTELADEATLKAQAAKAA